MVCGAALIPFLLLSVYLLSRPFSANISVQYVKFGNYSAQLVISAISSYGRKQFGDIVGPVFNVVENWRCKLLRPMLCQNNNAE